MQHSLIKAAHRSTSTASLASLAEHMSPRGSRATGVRRGLQVFCHDAVVGANVAGLATWPVRALLGEGKPLEAEQRLPRYSGRAAPCLSRPRRGEPTGWLNLALLRLCGRPAWRPLDATLVALRQAVGWLAGLATLMVKGVALAAGCLLGAAVGALRGIQAACSQGRTTRVHVRHLDRGLQRLNNALVADAGRRDRTRARVNGGKPNPSAQAGLVAARGFFHHEFSRLDAKRAAYEHFLSTFKRHGPALPAPMRGPAVEALTALQEDLAKDQATLQALALLWAPTLGKAAGILRKGSTRSTLSLPALRPWPHGFCLSLPAQNETAGEVLALYGQLGGRLESTQSKFAELLTRATTLLSQAVD